MNIKDKLRQLDRTSPAPQKPVAPQATGVEALAAQLGGEIMNTGHGPWIHVVRQLPLQTRHGPMPLDRIFAIENAILRLIAKNQISERYDLRQALFIDTETTGLAGGAGTYVFLIGAGYVQGEHFVVEQMFLPQLGAEAAMLAHFETLLSAHQGLVSFNGKSYDVPLLTNRFIQQRMSPFVGMHEHLDLLHIARRLFANDFGDCSLGTLERQVLQVQRNGDIPGAEIPRIYMDYLRYGEADLLPAVLYHNRMDIVSMVALVIHLVEMARLAQQPNAEPVQAARVAKLHMAVRAPQRAAHIFENILSSPTLRGDEEIEFLLHYARTQKKLRQYPLALQAWQQIIEKNTFCLEPFVELAKFHEHQDKDFARALQYTERALRAVETKLQLASTRALLQDHKALLHRRNRLLQKLRRLKK
ncbi:MAG: hypothetical protein D6814_14670 [Calditrichaeota bacterium]|nr:MAG: hypothetical protein D6814_14670 [Calditrichota bacterium]